ncbi:MAG TPA: cysteine peptidase family C39 domain-containing protein, partial [Verrucomicrobiae bacterium]|nr:cysteine peptidase family C39 domain-containing protein [Verrucomicrobiae bacterium]
MNHFLDAFDAAQGSSDAVAQSVAISSSAGLAKLLALTGRIADLNTLESEVSQLGLPAGGSEWGWAREMRAWVAKHPNESYKCGLYCLDQLGRLTQPGQFLPKDVDEVASSTNGFTAADLLTIATAAGLRVHAAFLTNFSALPVPSIMHLRSDHFVVIREQRGAFYNIYDPVAYGSTWLTAPEMAQEATGCVVVSDALPPSTATSLTSIDPLTAAGYRGRCHNPFVPDHNDPGCTNATPTSCPCPTNPSGGGGGGPPGGPPPNEPPASGPPPGAPPPAGPPPNSPPPEAQTCSSCGGMPIWFVTEPFVNVWLHDTPMQYQPAYGPVVQLGLSFHDRTAASRVSGAYWHGAQMGNNAGSSGLWSCSFFSFVELSSDEYTADLMLPTGAWATFDFASGSSISSINYWHQIYLEKQGPAGAITNLVLHFPNGSQASYGLEDSSDTSYEGLFYMTQASDASGISTSFAYDQNFYLTNVTAADGTTFSLQFTNNTASAVTAVVASYGASVSFGYFDYYWPILTNLVDAAGLASQFVYTNAWGGPLSQLITPYGTTSFAENDSTGIFDRTVLVTNSLGQQEFYAQMNQYTNTDWPDYATSQIPTNTPVGTLDKDAGSRQERNTFYWNPEQFANYVNTDPGSFDWAIFKQARIRHWLADTEPTYTHWDSLSLEQAPSPDGTTEGQITWYDYACKPAGVDYEVGAQKMPSVIARVMPDGSTWYQYLQLLTNGLPTQITEAWLSGSSVLTRSEGYFWSANNSDLIAWTNTLGIVATSNIFNAFHQVTTNYDALGQATTYAYDGTTHQITNATYASGLTTSYAYNAGHRLQQVTDSPINRTRSYTWNTDGTVFSSTDERGLTVTNFWDALHRPTGRLYPDGTSTTNLYYLLSGSPYANSSGGTSILDLTAAKDRLGYWTYYVYDALRREIAETNANSVVTAFGYCPCGGVSYITNALGTPVQAVTINNYDQQGNLITVNYADGYNVTNWFNSLQEMTESGDGTGY